MPVETGSAPQTPDRLRTFKRLLRSPQGLIGFILVVGIVLSAIFAPELTSFSPTDQHLETALQPPGAFPHILGTDNFGRDLLSRILYGARLSLTIGLVSVAIGLFVGVVLGVLAGYFGGWIASIIVPFIDIMLGFRTYLLAIMVAAILGTSFVNLMVAIGISIFPQFARLIRAEVLSVKSRLFVEAARSIGAPNITILFRHVLPHVIAPLVVIATFNIANATVVAAALSFLGLGPAPPTPAWGLMISEGRQYIIGTPWLPAIPGFAIMFTVLGFNLLGDTLRDILDPRLQGE